MVDISGKIDSCRKKDFEILIFLYCIFMHKNILFMHKTFAYCFIILMDCIIIRLLHILLSLHFYKKGGIQ